MSLYSPATHSTLSLLALFFLKWNEVVSAAPLYLGATRSPKTQPFFPPLFFSSLHPACPSFSSHPTSPHPLHAQQCVKNSSADKADLSFCHGGREGRQTVECPGTGSREGLWALRYASLRPPLLHPPSPSQPHSLSACFHDPCSALGGLPPIRCLAFSCPTCTNQTHLSPRSADQQPRIVTPASWSCGLAHLDWLPALVSGYAK